VSTLTRRKLINTVTAFFVACLFAFYGLGKAGVHLGIVFFLWIGIFNLMIVAQFWSFANDVYTKDQGERLFAIVGFGASLGAVVGSRVVHQFIGKLGVHELMLVGAALLVAQVMITNWIDSRESDAAAARKAAAPAAAKAAPKPSGGHNAFQMVFKTRYLLLMAFMLLLANTVNTTGEYILGSIVKDAAVAHVGDVGGDAVKNEIAAFYSTYFTYVNIIGLLMQLFVVSRVVKYFGVPIAIMVLPAVAMGAYSIITFLPLLHAVLAAKVAENSTDYSLNNTVRNMLFLPCTPEQKYSAKQAIDSFFVRMGDVVSAAIVFVCTSVFSLHPRGFALINLLMVVAWLLMARRIGREYGAISASGQPPMTTA
jgi:AAA family ATP:ADP antiporter